MLEGQRGGVSGEMGCDCGRGTERVFLPLRSESGPFPYFIMWILAGMSFPEGRTASAKALRQQPWQSTVAFVAEVVDELKR